LITGDKHKISHKLVVKSLSILVPVNFSKADTETVQLKFIEFLVGKKF